ncbi:MAG: hypothetical protein IKV50_04900 [Clostridia bacterium]|nr:hypothetical protein [Clostridia bacterium]
MKYFLKVRLLPICLLLILLFQAIPVTAHGGKTISLGTRYVSEERLYGLITPDFSVSHLYYDQLENDIQRNIFDDICCASPEYSSFQVTLTDLPEFIIEGNSIPQEVQDAILAYVDSYVMPAYAAAFLDNPLLFWANGVSYSVDISMNGTQVTEIMVTCMLRPFGGYTDESYEETLVELEQIFLSLPLLEGSNPYEWMKIFHDYLCETVVYVESTNSHNIIGPLLEGKSVCEGYAKAFKIFCELLEIPSAMVIGVGYTSSGSEGHAWNVVRMEDGNWYAVDVTWDDQESGIYYDFFLVGGETVPTYFNPIPFNQSHVANGDFFGTGEVILTSTALHPTAYDPANAHTHVYEAEITYPTCTEGGYTTYTCECGDSYTDDYADPTGHDYTEWEIEVFPTCQGSGTLRRECLTCGLEDKIFSTPANHQYEAVVTEPTCTEEGYTVYTCSVCGDVSVDEIVPALGHTYESVVIEPTCEKDGYTVHTCHCGDSYITDTVASLGHNFEESTVPPTCEKDGSLLFTCSYCGRVDSKILPPIGHNYKETYTHATCTEQGYATFTCENCGDSYIGNYVDPLGHSWDEGVVTVQPTEEQEGAKLFTCENCGETYTEALPRLEHIHKLTSTVTPPACTGEGYTTYSCECGMFYTDDYLPATGHHYVEDSRQPTCVEEGYKSSFCEYCGEGGSETIPAIGHNFGEWKDVALGVEERSCENCGETESREKEPNFDVDGNGVVDESDVTLLMSILVGNAQAEALIDLDFDGKLTIYDCVLLLQQLS